MLEEVIMEVALCRCWHLTDHTAVISPLHLSENVKEKNRGNMYSTEESHKSLEQ